MIFAKTINLGAASTTVTGNVCTESANPGSATDRTWTEVSTLSDICQADTDITFPSSPASYEIHLKHGYGYDAPWGEDTYTDTCFYCAGAVHPGSGGSYLVNGIVFDRTTDEYTFSDTNLERSYYVKKGNNTVYSDVSAGKIKFDSSANDGVKITKQITAKGDIAILGDSTIIDTDLVFEGDDAAGGLILGNSSGYTVNIDGDFIVLGQDITFNNTTVLDP